MPITDLFQSGTDKVLDDRVARPLAEPVPQRSFGANLWGVVTAVPKGATAGAGEAGGFFSDILGAYGDAQAGYLRQLDPSLMTDPNKAEAVREEGGVARARFQTGEAFNTDVGGSLRASASSYMPDPQSASTAENLLFGLGRFATKAVGYTMAGGPIPGAVVMGADEGLAESERLKAQGVDAITRTKVGAVAGVTSSLAVAMPVAGNTIKSTAALVVAGGPGGFIAQQAASKAILENAGYDKIGNQYDPFDPVGLAVSTLVPAAFGGIGLRANRAAPAAAGKAVRDLSVMGGNELRALPHNDARLDAYAVTAAQREGIPPEALLAIKNAGERSESGQVSPKGAKGVMQFMDDTWATYGKGDPRNPVDAIDAGARYMKTLIDQYGGDVRAAIAHYNGGGKAGKAVREGKAPPKEETQAYLERTDRYMAEKSGELAGKAVADDPEMVAAARVQQVRDTLEAMNLAEREDPAGAQRHVEGVQRAADQIAGGERVDIGDTVPVDTVAGVKVLDHIADRLEQSRADLLPETAGRLEPAAVEQIRAEIARLEESRPPSDAAAIRELAKEIQARDGVTVAEAKTAAQQQVRDRLVAHDEQITRLRDQVEGSRVAGVAQQQVGAIDQQLATVRAARAGEPTPGRKMTLEESRAQHAKQDRLVQEAAAKAEARKAGKSEPAAKAPETPPGAPKAQGEANPVAASIDAQSAEIARLSPDMLVQLEGMDAPMRVADLLEAVKAEAARDVQDAPLLQVAAECFLRTV